MPGLEEAGGASAPPVSLDAPASPLDERLSHNLAGQRLGRKGRVTRERILAAAIELIESSEDATISMSAVARRASLGMTSLYNYFSDITELLLALLEPVMETAEEAYLGKLRVRWSDDELGACCVAFVHAYHSFWARNARLLHLRNALADGLDERMMRHRVGSTLPIIALLVRQMGGDDMEPAAPAFSMATMAMIGIDRSITIATDRRLRIVTGWNTELPDDRYVKPGARLLELSIADVRRQG